MRLSPHKKRTGLFETVKAGQVLTLLPPPENERREDHAHFYEKIWNRAAPSLATSEREVDLYLGLDFDRLPV